MEASETLAAVSKASLGLEGHQRPGGDDMGDRTQPKQAQEGQSEMNINEHTSQSPIFMAIRDFITVCSAAEVAAAGA